MKLISVYEGVWVNWSVSSEWSARAIQIRPTGPRHDRTAARQWQQEAVPPLSLVLTGLRESVSPLSLFLFLTARFLPSALIRLPSRRSLVDAADGVSRTATSWTFVSGDRDQERISFLFSFLSFFFFFFLQEQNYIRKFYWYARTSWKFSFQRWSFHNRAWILSS